jgi:MinD-like ATPase involved in chromosome partitioning or flagellar assembly
MQQQDKVQIIIKGIDQTDDIQTWAESGDKINITYKNGSVYSYSARNVKIIESALADENAAKCFEYLKRIAAAIGLSDPRGKNILQNRYEKIGFISDECVLGAFLKGAIKPTGKTSDKPAIFPFGFNLSQKIAVDNALENPLSIIEGPPGTGKTQTILNIIANAVMRGESVAVVSSNNSATTNVLEKLQKYKVDFIAAYLGNTDNKREFIESQKPMPDLRNWELVPGEEWDIKQSIPALYDALNKMLATKNALSKIKQEHDALNLEYRHFQNSFKHDDEFIARYLGVMDSNTAAKLWLRCERYIESGKMPNFFRRLINRFLYKVRDKQFYLLLHDAIISLCQTRWYQAKIEEITAEVKRLQTEIADFDFDAKMKEYSEQSSKLFRNELTKKYKGTERHKFALDDLWQKSDAFIREYPVILATTYSLRSSLSNRVMYDYVIIDESSQVDLATGALALSCAKKAVVVGDLKQLPNVVDSIQSKQTDDIFAEFDLPETYRYKNHSLLLAISELFPDAPRAMLREHYRCHPKIIEFCNKKFYDNQLIILTEAKSTRHPLVVYKTVPGNHAREHVNQRQIDVIKDEIIPGQKLTAKTSIGIVTPYRNQTNALQNAFSGTGILADTVDKFQGRENDVIILSTVDNEISDFTDNANRLNVAVSRAIEQLIVVINGNDDMRDTNISDLILYIEYNNLEIIHSEIYSVFDYLYKHYNDRRIEILKNANKISEYDSENLMHTLIKDVLQDSRFTKFDVAPHVPLRRILRDMTRLDDAQRRYADNMLTHVDFLIFDTLGKIPRLAIEVDGAAFHMAGSRQAERDKMKDEILGKYGLPILRFRTTDSAERKRLISKLKTMIF